MKNEAPEVQNPVKLDLEKAPHHPKRAVVAHSDWLMAPCCTEGTEDLVEVQKHLLQDPKDAENVLNGGGAIWHES